MKHKIYTKTIFDMARTDIPIVHEEWEWSDRPLAECKNSTPVGRDREFQGPSDQEKRLLAAQEKAIKEFMAMTRKNEPLIRELIDQGYTEEDAVTLAAKQRALDAFAGDVPVSPAQEREIELEDQAFEEHMRRQLGENWRTSTPGIQSEVAQQESYDRRREESRRATLGQSSDIYQKGHFTGWGLSDQERFNKISALTSMGTPYLQGAQGYAIPAELRQSSREGENQLLMQRYGLRHQANVAKSQSTGQLISGPCCFIFIAADDGWLDPVVRRYRDLKMTVHNKRGYYWLSDRLVPLMKKFKKVKRIVRFVMVGPMKEYGRYYFKQNKTGVVFAPVAAFWLCIFTLLGMRKPYQRKGTNEIV